MKTYVIKYMLHHYNLNLLVSEMVHDFNSVINFNAMHYLTNFKLDCENML